MIEVFKTNVKDPLHAAMLLEEIHHAFSYTANFDLEDCDRVLRVQCNDEMIQSSALVNLFKNMGYEAEILSDQEPSPISIL